ncbi:hypothetical protein B0H17DRAFT_1238241 [Mycena rosella]|uniref:Phosphatase 2A Regulatory Subunit A helical domain-containing protein n=1 Tax=Mycena rosella TaxID=1033263 RepID=A0AAD7D2W8_MYCRO|nr:hypothetical protein B0H17DRAFT_1238241 [Mycena rosella]
MTLRMRSCLGFWKSFVETEKAAEKAGYIRTSVVRLCAVQAHLPTTRRLPTFPSSLTRRDGAPTRFYTAAHHPEIGAKKSKIALDENEGKQDGKVTESVDCFRAGRVIAELFLQGAPLFTLSRCSSPIEDQGVQETQLVLGWDSWYRDAARCASQRLGSRDGESLVQRRAVPRAGSCGRTVMNVKLEYNSSASMSGLSKTFFPSDYILPPAKRSSRGSSVWLARCRSPKVRVLDVSLALSYHLTDEATLDRMVPYIVELLYDESATLIVLTVITPSNVSIFPEYMIPNIKYGVQDPEASVLCTYAQCIAQLVDTAVRYMALEAHATFKLPPEAQEYDHARFEEACMQDLQGNIQEHLSALLLNPASVVKRAVLHDISSMYIFLGRQKPAKDLVRHGFFASIGDAAACAGGRSSEECILPLMIQALSKMRIWELMNATLGFLYHPICGYGKSDVAVTDEQSLLTAMTPLTKLSRAEQEAEGRNPVSMHLVTNTSGIADRLSAGFFEIMHPRPRTHRPPRHDPTRNFPNASVLSMRTRNLAQSGGQKFTIRAVDLSRTTLTMQNLKEKEMSDLAASSLDTATTNDTRHYLVQPEAIYASLDLRSISLGAAAFPVRPTDCLTRELQNRCPERAKDCPARVHSQPLMCAKSLIEQLDHVSLATGTFSCAALSMFFTVDNTASNPNDLSFKLPLLSTDGEMYLMNDYKILPFLELSLSPGRLLLRSTVAA